MSDSTTPQDDAAMPPASTGSLAWIPVTDHLPVTYSEVIVAWVTFKGVPLVDPAIRRDFDWVDARGRSIASSAVKFWMPLPKPPYGVM